jgi:hypothetical protein
VNKLLLPTLVGLIFNLLNAPVSLGTEQRTYAKDEVVVHASFVHGVMQSSLIKYEDWFLFVIDADQIRQSPRDGAYGDDLVPLADKKVRVEILAPKSTCLNEVNLASIWQSSFLLEISKVKNLLFMPTPSDPHHDYFLKLEPIVNGQSNRAECLLNKKM